MPRRAVPKVGAEPSHEVIDEGYADAFVQRHMVGPCRLLRALARVSGGTRKTWHPDGIEYHPKLRALVALAHRNDARERSPLPQKIAQR